MFQLQTQTTLTRFGFLAAVKMSMLVVWVVTPCVFLRNVGIYLHVHTVETDIEFNKSVYF
jgi:hypothetical protein